MPIMPRGPATSGLLGTARPNRNSYARRPLAAQAERCLVGGSRRDVHIVAISPYMALSSRVLLS